MATSQDLKLPTPQAQSTLADLAVIHPAAARVFYRHGLDFCCGGRRPLADVCATRGLDPAAIVAEIEAESPAAADHRRWDHEPLGSLIAFIVGTYHRRLRESFPDLIRMAERVEQRHGDKPGCPHGLSAHLHVMYEAVLTHLDKEEQVLFPLLLAGRAEIAAAPANVIEKEHDEHARSLVELRRLTNDMRAPEAACVTWRALYLALQQFEEELMVHVHLENNVLFRRALAA